MFKRLEDEVNDFFHVLAGHPVDSHKLTPLQQHVVKLNNICANIFEVSGSAWKATSGFIFGEANQNQTDRGGSDHYE